MLVVYILSMQEPFVNPFYVFEYLDCWKLESVETGEVERHVRLH